MLLQTRPVIRTTPPYAQRSEHRDGSEKPSEGQAPPGFRSTTPSVILREPNTPSAPHYRVRGMPAANEAARRA